VPFWKEPLTRGVPLNDVDHGDPPPHSQVVRIIYDGLRRERGEKSLIAQPLGHFPQELDQVGGILTTVALLEESSLPGTHHVQMEAPHVGLRHIRSRSAYPVL